MGLFGAWLLVLILTTTLTWQIVSAADDRVSDRPDTALNVAAPALVPDPTSTTIETASTLTIPDPVPTTVESPTTTVPSSTTTTSSPGTTAPPETTTTTSDPWSVKTVPTSGGTVVLKYRPGEVVLQTATPAAGFHADVEKPGPPTVEVDFESEERKVEVQAEWKDGGLDVDVSESDEEDDD